MSSRPTARISPRQLGGNASLRAAGMRLWGVDVSLVSVVGADYPSAWLEQLSAAGIDISAITRISEPHLLRSRAFYFPDGSRTDRVDEGPRLTARPRGDIIDLESEYTDTGSPLHRRIWPTFCPDLSHWEIKAQKAAFAHFAPGPLPCSRNNAAFLKQRRAGQVTISFDWPWWDWDQEGQVDAALLRNIDYLLPSIEELALHADAAISEKERGEHSDGHVFEAARRLLDYGPKGVGVKMGRARYAPVAERRAGLETGSHLSRPGRRSNRGPETHFAAAFWSACPVPATPSAPVSMAPSPPPSSSKSLASCTRFRWTPPRPTPACTRSSMRYPTRNRLFDIASPVW